MLLYSHSVQVKPSLYPIIVSYYTVINSLYQSPAIASKNYTKLNHICFSNPNNTETDKENTTNYNLDESNKKNNLHSVQHTCACHQ